MFGCKYPVSSFEGMQQAFAHLTQACRAASPALAGRPTIRWLHAGGAALATDVTVPSMGDSITEGSIASVLKAAQDTVDEDEALLQIDTDKVLLPQTNVLWKGCRGCLRPCVWN